MYFPKKTVVVKGIPIDMPLERLLNAKFTHEDGREVVFSLDGEVVTNDVDKGTYNYVNGTLASSVFGGGHDIYDVEPYFRQMKGKMLKKRYNKYPKGSELHKNSYFWPPVGKK